MFTLLPMRSTKRVGFEDVDDEMHDENDVATRGRRK